MIPVELRHLRHFIAVAEELHFARAAERLGIEQSPLSHSIRNLESELGVKLFHRTTRRTWLTRAGVRFYADAVRVLADVEALKSAARNEELSQPQRIVIGLTESAALEPFTRFLFELEHRNPPIWVDLREVAPGEAARLVVEGVLDLAIVLEALDSSRLRRVRAWAEPLMLIAPFSHPVAECDRVSLKEIATERFILAHSGPFPGYAAQIERLLDRYQVRTAGHTMVKHQNTMVSFTAAGRGLSLLPESIAHGLTTVAVVPFAEGDAELVSWLLYREEDASDGMSFALEVASVISRGGELPSDDDFAS